MAGAGNRHCRCSLESDPSPKAPTAGTTATNSSARLPLSSKAHMRQGSRSPALSNSSCLNRSGYKQRGSFLFSYRKSGFFLTPPPHAPTPTSLLESSIAREHSGHGFSSSGKTPLLHICSRVSESPWRDPTCGHEARLVTCL